MKIRVPEYFKDFKCISSECEDTCCAGWGIVIDDETYKKYQKVEGPFGERLRNEIVHDAGENIFVLRGNNCPFLDEKKLCDIYKNVGEDALCYTCKQYPRYTEEFGSLREVGISLSCPEAARIILRNSKKATFELDENDEEVNSYNDINAKLYLELIQCRKIILDIIQDREIDLNVRASIVLYFTKEIQDKIDENDINNYTLKSIRENISIVTQEIVLLNDTIYNNLTMLNSKIKKQQVDDILDVIQMSDFIKTLPNGLDTEIGEGGVKLSGGQRQRIAIGRALLRDSKVIIFDEATSSLDNNCQELIMENLYSQFENKVVIIIAHRLSTIKKCDEINVLKNGKIIERGTYKELMAKMGELFRMENK